MIFLGKVSFSAVKTKTRFLALVQAENFILIILLIYIFDYILFYLQTVKSIVTLNLWVVVIV
jgi:hypothetical protein